jgi:hypothetical protein
VCGAGDRRIIMEHWRNDADSVKRSTCIRSLPKCHFFHDKFYPHVSVVEPWSPQTEVGVLRNNRINKNSLK